MMKNKVNHFPINVKNILSCFLIIMLSILSISCDNSESEENDIDTQIPGEGIANIILTAGGQEFKIVGPCGWASAMGVNYIGANHESNKLRVFAANFNITKLPTVTTSYTVVEGSSADADPTHIAMSISEISGNNTILTSWSSKATSGKLTLTVSGNKVTADLAGITLYPQTNSGFYTNGNTGAFANNGALTGTLTFYK